MFQYNWCRSTVAPCKFKFGRMTLLRLLQWEIETSTELKLSSAETKSEQIFKGRV